MEEIMSKVHDAPTAVPTAAASPPGTMEIAIRVSACSLTGQKKRAEVWGETPDGRPQNSRWAMFCDEGKAIGGDDSAPPPLAYFSAGIAF